jgi:hypothetical protein
MCGAAATTGEHKVKRSDLLRVHGSTQEFRKAGLRFLRSDGEVLPLPGPNSKHLKFEDVLCAPCNNEASQPFDRAYDRFIQFVEDEEDELLRGRVIDFPHIYGEHWPTDQIELYKYFVKAFGCRLAHAGVNVPHDLRMAVRNQRWETPIGFCFSVDEREACLPERSKALGLGQLATTMGPAAISRFSSILRYRWLLVSCWYGLVPHGSCGQVWDGAEPSLGVGTYDPETSPFRVQGASGEWLDWPGLSTDPAHGP